MVSSVTTNNELKDERFGSVCKACAYFKRNVDNVGCQICSNARVRPERIINCLCRVKIAKVMDEHEIHKEIKKVFDSEKIIYRYEHRYAKRTRFDFWINGLIIEVKKNRPTKSVLLSQLNRYSLLDGVQTIIVVLEKAIDLPNSLNDVFIYTHSLNANWGIAV